MLSHATGWELFRAVFVQVQTTDDLPKLTMATFIGIMVATTGNVLISLALNLQKLAHKRVETNGFLKQQGRESKQKGTSTANGDRGSPENRFLCEPNMNERDEERPYTPTPEGNVYHRTSIPMEAPSLTTSPTASSPPRDYGTIHIPVDMVSEGSHSASTPKNKRNIISYLFPNWFRSKFVPSNVNDASPEEPLLPVEAVRVEEPSFPVGVGKQVLGKQGEPEGNETEYLKSKLWWLGFLLMNIGEMGNFISYAWAPASVVAPLGTFSLVANCIFAPLLLGERFRMRDLLGILIACIGAVTVVLASNTSDTRLDPDTLLCAISQKAFIIYSCIYVGGAMFLATLSQGSIGRQWVFVDVGLCALFGGFTVLSTKAISTLLTMEWIEMFSKWITYPVLAVLILTGVGQIRYLNRALMRFDSKVVIPVQFVLFTLSAIIGSAILYGDFRTAKFHQVVTFLYGCATTFLGVFVIAWGPGSHDGDRTPEDVGDADTVDSHLTPIDGERRPRPGVIGGRRRHSAGGGRETPTSRPPPLSLIGVSPAQHLLLVYTPPHDSPIGALGDSADRRRAIRS